jgi:NADH-quinone oxidoreductase subunit F
VIEVIGGGPIGDRVVAVVSGTANPILPGDRLDAPVSYEGLRDAGGGLGSAGFIVIDDQVDIVSVRPGPVPVPGHRVLRAVLALQAGRP